VLKRLSTVPIDTFVLAMAASVALAALLPRRDRAAVQRLEKEFGVRSSDGAGVFPGATVGVIMLPLMIFHQIQLVVCSVIASRLSRDPLPEAVGGEPGAGPLA
jgi:predicted Na+-dependent transporter